MTLLLAIADFLSHCLYEKGLSKKTLKAYETDLRQFVSFSSDVELIAEVSKYHIRGYLTNCSTLKPKSIKRKIATLKALFNYLEFEDKILLNPFRKMKIKIKEPKELCKVMDLHDIKKIYKVGYSKLRFAKEKRNKYAFFEALRNIVVIELLFATGGRVSEIADLKKENINLQSGCITIKGKGNKERIIQVCNQESLSILREYYLMGKSTISTKGWFLINRFNQKLSDQSIRSIVGKLSSQAGIQKHITPHVFRHTFGTLLLEKGVDIRYIQSLLGHSSIVTTQMYTHVNAKKQRQILLSKHPRRDFSIN